MMESDDGGGSRSLGDDDDRSIKVPFQVCLSSCRTLGQVYLLLVYNVDSVSRDGRMCTIR